MKLYPDGVAEGTPEECAAFKHIDAALESRNSKRPAMKALESGKPKPKKVPSKRVTPPKRSRRSRDEVASMNNQILTLASSPEGVTSQKVSEYFEIDGKRAYQMLYSLRGKGLLWLTDGGVFKAEKSVESVLQ